MGIKVFLSYGHDDNTDLVLRIKRDLEAAGHRPWIDTSGIKTGDDWRRSILDGLADTDWTLAFLSRHAVREGGVCLDEIALAMGMRHGNLATILVEPEDEVQAPVSVSHIQWLDMSGWADHDDAWYQAKLRAILDLLADPETHRFRGEIEELERLLHPITQAADIPPLIDGFVGREWVVEKVNAWRRDDRQRRAFWLTGGPGAGKSAFTAWIAHYQRGNVVCLNLCKWNDEDRSDPRRVMRTLAFLLATRLRDYRRRLLDRLHTLDPDGSELARKGAAAMFNWLLAEPLQLIDGGRRRDRCVVVIDALDETLRDGISELADVLAELTPKLPPWMAVLLTSRPDFPIAASLSHIAPLRLDGESSADNANDLRVYARGWLATPERTPAEAEALIARVVAAADGNFMYLRKLHEAVNEFDLDLLALDQLPQGLTGLYRLWFRRQFPDRNAYRAEFAPFIEVLVAANSPVPIDVLRAMFGWDVPTEARLLEGLGSLFEERAHAVTPFHASLRDWLIDRTKSGAEFVVDAPRGGRRLAEALWPRLVALLATPAGTLPDAFTLAELPVQMLPQDAASQRAQIATAGGWQPVASQIVDIARILQQSFEWRNAIGWLALLDKLGDACGDAGWDAQRWAMAEIGDIHLTVGETNAALTAFQKCNSITARLAAADPGSAQWQRDLSVSQDRIGDVLSAQGDLPRALDAFRAGIDISARLAAADPGNAQWQRDLSISHNKIGDVLSAQGDLPRALDAFRAGIDISARLAAADPGNAQWQRDLSVSQDRIGDVLSAQGDLPRALDAFRAGIDISARLAAADPGDAQWQRDLSVSHNKIGDVLTAQGDLPRALDAFRASHDIFVRLAAADPGNAEWQRDLSVSHNKIGDVLTAQGDLPRALDAFRTGMDISARLAAADPANAQWQRDLSVSQERIGDVLTAQGDLPRALDAFRAGMDIRARLAAADPGNAQWQRDLSVSHNKIGDVLTAQGDLPRALDAFRAGIDIRARLTAADPGNAQWQRDLSVSHSKIGDVLSAQGDLPRALDAFRAGIDISARLAAADPGNAQWQRDLSVSHIKIGDVLSAQGDLPRALDAFRAGIDISARLAAADPGNAQWQRDLSVSHNKIGDVLTAQGDLPRALDAFRTGIDIRTRLAAADPGNAQWQRDVIVSCVKLAEADPSQAHGPLTRALKIARDLAAAGRLAPVDAWIPADIERRLGALAPEPGVAP